MKTNLLPKRLPAMLLAAGIALPLLGQAQQCIPGTYFSTVESGNVKTQLLNAGDMFWDLAGPRFEVPKGSGKHSIYAGGIWFGGIDQATNQLNATVTDYRAAVTDGNLWPGPLDGNGTTADSVCTNWNYIAKVNASVINTFLNQTFPVDQSQIPMEILHWPAWKNSFRPDLSGAGTGRLAPFMDVDADGTYDPRQGDYPLILGDQAVYTIMNDAGGVKSVASGTTGLEVHVMMYGFDNPANPAINNTIFARYILINKGNKTLADTYFGKWVDFDLGNYLDDYVGSDSTQSMFYAFNADNNDEGLEGYGPNPPAQGVIFLNAPMTNFTYFKDNNSGVNGEPVIDTDFYNYMQSRWKNGNPITYGGDGTTGTVPAKFMFSGDPVSGTGWTELSAGIASGDRRGIGAHGPFTFAPGEIKVFDVAYPWAQGSSHLNSITELKQAATQVQNFYNSTILGIEAVVSAPTLSLQLYPNPTTGTVNVQSTSNLASEATFTLQDLTGRTLLQTKAQLQSGTSEHQLNIAQVPQGMYLLQVQRGDVIQTVRVVKQ